MPPVQLTKHVALGNDFLIAIDPPRPLTSGDAVAWCDRRRGIGADGLITLTSTPGDASRWTMVLLNSDGGRAEISGNGARAVGQALTRHTEASAPVSFSVDTDAGLRPIDVVSMEGSRAQVRIDMGPVRSGPPVFDGWSELGVEVTQQVGLDIGNPHVVALVADPDAHDLAVVGPAVEAHYPEGINVHLISTTADDAIELRVWERGAGLTEACGSGACAAAAATINWGLTGSRVLVTMPGGTATVERTDSGHLLLTGPTDYIAAIMIDSDSPTHRADTVDAHPTLEEV